MIDFDASTILIFGFFFLIVAFRLKRKKEITNIYLLFFAIFYIYIVGVLSVTIFPIPIDPFMKEVMQNETTFLKSIILVPFIFNNPGYISNPQMILNIILSVPFGFGISYVKNINSRKLIIYGLSFGIAIETLQMIISMMLGFVYRVVDINDVIFNCIGVVLGYLIFVMLSKLLLKLFSKEDFVNNSVLRYVYSIAKSVNSENRGGVDVFLD